MIDPRSLQFLLRVAELGAINRAAQSLGVSQPTLTRAIQLLEQQLGQQRLIASVDAGRAATPSVVAMRAMTDGRWRFGPKVPEARPWTHNGAVVV